MAKYEISVTNAADGLVFTLEKAGLLGLGRTGVPCDAWTPDLHPGVSLLKLLMDNEAATPAGVGVLVTHETIACMSASEISILGLPPHCSYSLHLTSSGAISGPTFAVGLRWIDGGTGDVAGLRRAGAMLESVAERFVLGEPLFSLAVELEKLNVLGATPLNGDFQALDKRMIAFDRVKLALSHATGDVGADDYLENLTIHHATGIAIEGREGGADHFEPILYGDAANPAASPDHEEAVPMRRPLLPPDHALKFRTVLFPGQGARSHYRLGKGVYAVVDAPVEAAMRVVERINRSDASTRAAFRANPRSFLIEEVEEAGGSGDVICDSPIVREPMEYGERVLGVQQWDGVKISFKVPVFHNWFPVDGEEVELYTIEIPGQDRPLRVHRKDVAQLRTDVEAARAAGEPTFEFGGQTFPLLPDVESTISTLAGHVTPPPAKGAKAGGDKGKLLVLRAAENEEDLLFNARLRDPKGTLSRTEADAPLKTEPMPHQVDGIAWLRQAFLSGMPGVLLADDMGLGKTFQVLAFLNWLRSNEHGARRPILVVAPKKLLDVWRDQIAEHLGVEGLGTPVLAYDENLKHLKVATGKDGQLGRHTLDVAALRNADWVLTTYETLRDYHFSFGAVRFRIGIYDEAQKMKSIASLVNNAAKCQQPDFTILMTGTPIENSVMDLWTLMDIAWAGFLGMSGKEFAKTYGEDPDQADLDLLKSKLIGPVTIGEQVCPSVMLRRFKSTTLEGLPKKTEVPWREEMSPEQVRAYDAVVADQQSRRVPALQALQALRAAAFHPDLRMPKVPDDHRHLVQVSARFRALFKILDAAFKKGERVLVFIDLRKGQDVLRELIRVRFQLKRHPQVINGDTATKALDVIKSEFQKGHGFEVLLLGPRSAGFGLTLTAANHVVHLNRWWNPAVEDQCSDRVYRLGQDKDVFIHVPMAIHPGLKEGSFDEVLHEMLTKKRSLSREIVVPTTMTEDDFKLMFAKLVGGKPAQDGSLAGLDTMGWRGFEAWTADQFAAAGYQAHTTPNSGDRGADIVLRPPAGRRVSGVICQCKHRALGEGFIDEEAIHEVLKAGPDYEAKYDWLRGPLLVAVTNGTFTPTALKLARSMGVMVVDRSGIDGLEGFAKNLLAGAAAAPTIASA